jgi:hypothetical protein
LFLKAEFRERLLGAIAKGLAQLGCVDLGEPYFHLLLSNEDGQGVAIVDGYHPTLGVSPCR